MSLLRGPKAIGSALYAAGVLLASIAVAISNTIAGGLGVAASGLILAALWILIGNML